jgi:hypothetical protein
MRPKSTTKDLPSSYSVKIHLHNEFVKHIASLKAEITVSNVVPALWTIFNTYPVQAAPGKVSITQDGWSSDTTKAGFQGMTAHWIEVSKEGKWKMKAAVIGFKALSGGHNGENLGRYSVGLLDRVGIMDKKSSKVCNLSCKIRYPGLTGNT